ncbi:MAG: VWA domain-containing protein [Planctomycetota bacterium]|nr:VWA domain-containing protein [Planctomycetota bacterium]
MTAIRFSGVWPWWLVLVLGILGAIWIARWVWRESRHVSNPTRWLLPSLRAAAFFLILFMLAGPTLYHQRIEGQLSRVRILLDTSTSMGTVDDGDTKAGSESRLARAANWLIGDEKQAGSKRGWLQALSQHHRVELRSSSSELGEPVLWDSRMNVPLPKSDSIVERGGNSPLGEFLMTSLPTRESSSNADPEVFTSSAQGSEVIAAVVLISDGQSNSGVSIGDAAQKYAIEKTPIFAIGVGNEREPADLGIVTVEHSQRVYRSDRLRGKVTIKERMPAGVQYRISITHLDKLIFSKALFSLDSGTRSVEFDIPGEPLVDRAKENLPAGSEYSTVPIDLRFEIEGGEPEITLENNAFSSSLWGVNRKNKVLVMDRRGGWELRYIKNAMERDAAWESTVAIGRSTGSQESFPKTRVELFEHDLIVTTLDTARELSEEQQVWLTDFVSVSGGGLVILDSKRERGASADHSQLSSLLPVTMLDQPMDTSSSSLKLTPAAKNQAAFQLAAGDSQNDSTWSQMPAPKSIRAVALAPGAEAMVELSNTVSNKTTQPLVATKLFGQGRVIYFAADESWRWRMNVADLYHQRFWNQIATWCMRAPFAMSDAFASLDSGARLYNPSSTITVRAKLKQNDAQPLENATVQAILERDGERYASFPLASEVDARGFYRTTFGPLPQGDYRVRLEVAGVPSDALSLSTQFVVQPPVNLEMQMLASNGEALRQAATLTGGEFAYLDSADAITDKLKQFRQGKMIETQTLLWQSFPWFATIIGLLAAEWYLRKRAGLI